MGKDLDSRYAQRETTSNEYMKLFSDKRFILKPVSMSSAELTMFLKYANYWKKEKL